MALDGTYTGLQATVAEWLDDTTLTASIPDFVRMAEARMNRVLNVWNMETRSDAVTSGEYLALPVDFDGLRSIFVIGSPNVPLIQMESGDMRRFYSNTATGKPQAYALSGGQIQFAPIPNAAYSLEIIYIRDLPPLATAGTNWLLTNHPDCYLYGVLMAAEMRGWNDARLPMLKAAFDTAIKEIADDSDDLRWGAEPLFPRIKQFR